MDSWKDKIRTLRTDYNLYTMDVLNAPENPLELFNAWFRIVIDKNLQEPNAMCLSTVSGEGRPSSRIVLLRSCDENGFVFFTNFNSHKGRELQENPLAALNFFWPELHQQVRIEGKACQIPEKESDAYFQSRPRESQIGAWASDQSKILKTRQDLDQNIQNLTHKFEGKDVPRPPHWGGFCIAPNYYEFWQGRSNRLHDRLSYTLKKDQSWDKQLLNP